MATIAQTGTVTLNEQGMIDVAAVIEDAIKNAPLLDWPSEKEQLAASVRTYLAMSPYAYDERFNYGEIVKHLNNREAQTQA